MSNGHLEKTGDIRVGSMGWALTSEVWRIRSDKDRLEGGRAGIPAGECSEQQPGGGQWVRDGETGLRAVLADTA